MKQTKSKLLHGDCLDPNIIEQFDDDLDIILFSPPYNLGKGDYFSKWETSKTTARGNKYKDSADYRDDYVQWLEQVIRTYIHKAQYVFMNLQKLAPNKKQINELLFRLNDVYCDEVVWNKTMGIPAAAHTRIMTAVYENVYIFSLKPTRRVGTKEWCGNVPNLFTLLGNRHNPLAKEHKAMFPVEFPLYIFETYVKEGGKVGDIMMGMGTSGIAAKRLGMDFVGVEIDDHYYKRSKERIENE